MELYNLFAENCYLKTKNKTHVLASSLVITIMLLRTSSCCEMFAVHQGPSKHCTRMLLLHLFNVHLFHKYLLCVRHCGRHKALGCSRALEIQAKEKQVPASAMSVIFAVENMKAGKGTGNTGGRDIQRQIRRSENHGMSGRRFRPCCEGR